MISINYFKSAVVLPTLLITLAAAATACKAEDPPEVPHDSAVDDAAPPDASGCTAPSSLKVSIDKVPNPTCYTVQPLRGTAKGAATITAQGGVGAAAPVSVNQSDGKFCIEVMLNSDSLNAITLQPIDANGCPGSGEKVDVTHKTCVQPDAGVAVTNLALGAAVNANKTPSKGDAGDLTDGKTSTVVEYAGGWGITNAGIKLSVALKQAVQVEKIVIRWRDAKGSGCDYGADYKLAYTSLSSPGEVDISGPWSELKSVTDGAGGVETYTYSSNKPFARHVGLIMDKNGCTGWTETFAIAELEIWAKDPSKVPLPPADRCP
jgi:hypothetical protein